MKSSRLSPAGRLWGGACMLGSGLESFSSACPLWGRKRLWGSPAGSRLPLSSGFNLGAVGGRGSGQLGGSSETQETGRCGHPPSGCPYRLLEAQWAACSALGRSSGWEWGRGRPSKEEEEGSWLEHTSSGQPLWGSHCTAWPSPPEGRQRELGQLAEAGPGTRTLFQFPLPPPGPVSICLPAGTKG